MSRGCVIALVAFGVAVLLFFIVVIAVPLYMFDVIRSAPRVPVDTFLTEHTVAALRVDPNQKPFLDIVSQAGRNVGWLMPYEVGAVVDLDPLRKTRTLTFAGSPKHLGPALLMAFGDKNTFPASEMDTKGIDRWLTPALTKEKGALILRGTGAVDAKTEALAAEHWPESAPRTAVKFEGGHAVEAVIANAGGEGVLALEPFFRPDDKKDAGGEGTGNAAATAPASAAESEPAPEAAPPAEAEPGQEPAGEAEEPEKTVTSEEESALGLLQNATEIHVVGDFNETGDFILTVTAKAKDGTNAALAKELLDGLREIIQVELAKEEITVTGKTSISGEVVTSEVIYSGYKERFAKWLQEMQQTSQGMK